MTEIYCVKCRSKTKTNNLHQVVIKCKSTNRAAIQGTCANCGTKKNQFVSNKGGSGLHLNPHMGSGLGKKKKVTYGAGIVQF